MQPDIHPEFLSCKVSCVCGNEFETLSSKPELRIDICNACHPFFTGKQKLMDTEGRVDRFLKKYGMQSTES